MLQALAERRITPDLLVGTSAGALNAVFVAAHGTSPRSLDRLAATWAALRRDDVFPLRAPQMVLALAGARDALCAGSGLDAPGAPARGLRPPGGRADPGAPGGHRPAVGRGGAALRRRPGQRGPGQQRHPRGAAAGPAGRPDARRRRTGRQRGHLAGGRPGRRPDLRAADRLLLSALSLVVAGVLLGAAFRGPRTASTVMIVLGVLFLVSALVNMALLRTAFNLLAFRMSNVVFSVAVGFLLLVLGAYGRLSGNLPETSPTHTRTRASTNRRTCPRPRAARFPEMAGMNCLRAIRAISTHVGLAGWPKYLGQRLLVWVGYAERASRRSLLDGVQPAKSFAEWRRRSR